MLRLVLTVMVFTLVLTLAASSAPQDCVDVTVRGNNSIKVKTFTSRKGEVLFLPNQGFQSVTIHLAAAERKSASQLTRADMCVNSNSSQWYRLKVKVGRGWYYQQCEFEVDSCSGKCSWVRDYNKDDFESFTVEAHGASLWSLNITKKAQCILPNVAVNNTPIPAHVTPTATNTRQGDKTLPVWLVGVGGGVLVLAMVIKAACIAARRIQPIRSSGTQQQHEDGRGDNSSPPRGGNSAHASNNSIYVPFHAVTDPNSGTHQQQQEDDSSRDCSRSRHNSMRSVTNSLYESYCAVTHSGNVIWRPDGNPTD